jgi:hypothetical protein
MIEIKYHVENNSHVEEDIVKFSNVRIFDDKFGKYIAFFFYKHNGERDFWSLHPYKKYADGEDHIKIDGKLYTGDELYRLAREILMKKEAESLDILEG